jgi:hypothetical protein
MAKDFASIYARAGDSIALEQSFFAKLETVKGTLIGPTDTDFFFTMGGGAITHTQPKQSSPHRSGRHNTDIFREKKATEWSIPTFVNIDTALGAAASTEVEAGIRLLWKSLLGKEDISAGAVYTSADVPDLTFSLFENGDKWAQQAPGSYVESCGMAAPGDGQAQLDWAGRSADRIRVGIGQSTAVNDGGNTVTLLVATEAKRFPVGGLVMLVEGDGTTRSADTLGGTYRTITARDTGTGVVTIDGAPLADADGSGGAGLELYLVYAEPETPTGIANIQTGLVGSISVDGLGGTVPCVRSFSVNFTNNHEAVDYCYGTDGLATPFFVPGGRLAVEIEMELNLNDSLIELLDDLDEFEAQDIDFILGDVAGRHLKIDIPKGIFDVPSTTLPEEGSIPVTLSGMGFQTSLGAADEVTVSYL